MSSNSELVTVNFGPQHPSMHGVFRMRETLDGESIVDIEPVFGYLHRGTEKLAEERTYVQIVTLTDRLDYVASMSNNLAYVSAVEKLCDIEVPKRASYLRVIVAELQRIASHLMATGFLLQDLGAFGTPLMYCFREREKILDMFESLCGARITLSYMRPGGVFQDTPEDFWQQLESFMKTIPQQISELESLITGNEIVLSRTRNIGVLSPEEVINGSLSGPMLRASRVKWDLRKANPYEVYDELDFDVPIGATGDTFDRYLIRIKEMKESIKIINQCTNLIKPGPVRNEDVPLVIRAPENEAYAAVEGPKGELGFYLVSDGGVSPYRCKIRAPSFMNLSLLREMAIGTKVGDLIVNFGSIDIVLGEVDR